MDAFEALADPVRRSLLRTVSDRSVRVSDLVADHDISRPAVSRHLRVLADAGLVEASAHGRERHFAARPAGLAPVSAYLAELAALADGATDWPVGPQALDALETEVRRTARERRTTADVRTHRTEETSA